MHHWTKRLIAIVATLSLTGCLWGPGKFASDLTLRKDGSFILDYRGEIVLQIPDENPSDKIPFVWQNSILHCFKDGHVEQDRAVMMEPQANGSMKTIPSARKPNERPCTTAELAKAKSDFEQSQAAVASKERESREQAAKLFGLPGLDDESNRAFAAKLSKYAGWRSVTYAGKGIYDVDYHMEGRLTQDFVFPMMPDSNIVIPFIALRRRSDGAVLVTAPALTGGMNMFGPMAQQMGGDETKGPPSRAEGRFTVHTDGQIVTNNSEDGPSADPAGQQVHWDIASGANKVPETLVRL